jgi:hypothetical protein
MKYKQFKKNGIHHWEHRYVWEQANGKIPKGMQIHHINGIKDDNRLENLRMVSSSENNEMKQLGKGYVFRPHLKKRKYQAIIRRGGVYKSIGSFGTPCGAYMAHRTYFI